MSKLTFVLLAAVLLAVPSMGEVPSRCSLAKKMHALGVPKDQLARWACIAHHESNYNTKAVGSENSNGSRDYGIFQINNYYWCQPSNGAFSYNECKIRCEDFLVNSIKPAVKCAQLVLKQQGWSAWSTWKYCDGRLPSINDCF